MSYSKHPNALVESDLIGEGTRIWAFAHVMPGAVIGRECNVGDHAFIEGGVEIGDRVTVKNLVFMCSGVEVENDVFLGPNVVFTNDMYPRSPRMQEVHYRYEQEDRWLEATRICKGSTIGANSTIVCGITIGNYAMVGAGSVVTDDVAPYSLVVGVPARHKGYVCLCGSRLRFEKSTASCKCGKYYEIRQEIDKKVCCNVNE